MGSASADPTPEQMAISHSLLKRSPRRPSVIPASAARAPEPAMIRPVTAASAEPPLLPRSSAMYSGTNAIG